MPASTDELWKGASTITGSSLLHEIQQRRISRAALLLRETDAPVKYITYRAGFVNHQRLRLAFVQQFNLSPKDYRLKQQTTPD